MTGIGDELMEELRAMEPVIRVVQSGDRYVYEASVGTGFETCWWPEGLGDTREEAISNLNKRLGKS